MTIRLNSDTNHRILTKFHQVSTAQSINIIKLNTFIVHNIDWFSFHRSLHQNSNVTLQPWSTVLVLAMKCHRTGNGQLSCTVTNSLIRHRIDYRISANSLHVTATVPQIRSTHPRFQNSFTEERLYVNKSCLHLQRNANAPYRSPCGF